MQQAHVTTSLQRMEQASEEWPKYIRLASLIIQRSLAEFISPLLMIGLILSMGNYLLGDAIFLTASWLAVVWVIVQVIAIDANMGLMIAQSVKEFHAGEWVKGAIYLLVSLALLFVAAIIFNTEALQSVIKHQVGTVIPVEALTIIRSAAVVALVAINQLGATSLRRQSKPASVSQDFPISGNDAYRDSGEQGGKQGETVGNTGRQIALNAEQLQRLEAAYIAMNMAGEEITVNKLRDESGVRSEVVGPWLKLRVKQENNGHLTSHGAAYADR